MKKKPGWRAINFLLHESQWQAVLIGTVYLALCWSLVAESPRWISRYSNLTTIAPTTLWAALFGLSGASLLVGNFFLSRTRWPLVVTLIAVQSLTALWAVSTIIEWITTQSTTPLPALMFVIAFSCLLRAMLLVDLNRILGIK